MNIKDPNARGQLFGELWHQYESTVDKMLRGMKRYMPEDRDKKDLLKEVKQQIQQKLLRYVSTYRRDKPFEHFLGVIVRSCLIDELRTASHRAKERPVTQFMKPGGNDTENDVLELLYFRSGHYCDEDPSDHLEKIDRKHVISTALTIYAQKGEKEAKSARIIKLAYWHELDRRIIAQQFGKDERTIYRYLHADLLSLKFILAQKFKITDMGQL
ncbi:MAG: sigma-70 family RNA polymerase sigma factor [Deltaproteobacteria bacterium]|nr:sigma-70 family RNA polymerase sigma factor [Deltaproteobacteria bacterium]